MTSAEATRTEYRSALDELWTDASRAITRLERIAGDPDAELHGDLDALPALQYALHRASEATVGIAPPPGTAPAHRELADALADARDVTGDVAALVEADDRGAAGDLVHEWRAVLFRVRLARRRLARPEPPPAVDAARLRLHDTRGALSSLVLLLAGTAIFAAGAVLALWPIWAVGLAFVALAPFVYRP